jgi:Tol biopolymer transport system component
MKKTLLLFSIFIISGQLLFAQKLDIQSITLLQFKNNEAFFYPKFSPKGDYLLTTSINYAGLNLYDFTQKTQKTLNTDAGAGYDVQMSEDGISILYKKTDFINNRRNNSLISYSRLTDKKIEISAPSREALTPKFAANKPTFVKGKKMIRSNVSSTEAQPIICIEDQKMVIYTASTRKVLTPNGVDASYIWPSISPDRKNIAYTVAGKGTFVCKIDGTNVKALGKLNAPTWLNNSWLVGMDDKDNGEILTSSSLVATTSDGKIRQTLTTPAGKMAMYPAASADGKRIAFNTEKGEIYILNIAIK